MINPVSMLIISKTMAYLIVLIYASYQDQKTRKIPNLVHLLIIMIAFIDIKSLHMTSSLMGLFAVSIPLLLVSFMGKNGMGGGDIKFMAANGFLLGSSAVICAGALGFILTLLAVMVRRLFIGHRINTSIAMAPYLSIGCFFIWLFTKVITIG